ncbi:hypothetical protein LOK49_LG08G01909 [Camellia lanceoleosa]|uniref:Uncharacterized protein n=1 Tax=Camellia lanceoleosa TaxID=1840588 RepID=A0ACC0GUS2_9ERIC|nr:hypothetical protein LOK49_LG08G01909 [Camellia lanceoleosa]
MRPLTAAVTAAGGNSSYILDGVPRMRERPIGDLVTGLKQLGANVDCFLGTNCPPVRVVGKGGLPGEKVKLSGSVSSQYLTALLMAAPLALGDMEIEIIDKLISIPYVEMTLKLMERFGVSVEHTNSWDRFLIHGGQKYKSPGKAFVEGDASSASYFLGGAAVTGGTITVEGCGTSSLQGDVKFAKVLEKMGAKVNWTENSDDVHYMLGALRTLGLHVEEDSVENSSGSYTTGTDHNSSLLPYKPAPELLSYKVDSKIGKSFLVHNCCFLPKKLSTIFRRS